MTFFTKLNIATHTSVLDNRSGLEWAVNVPSLQGKLFDHADAVKAIENLNAEKHLGYSDWRLPTPHELFGLVGYDYGDKCYDKDAFPDMRTDDWYWTSQVTHSSTSCVFAVGFADVAVGFADVAVAEAVAVGFGDGAVTDFSRDDECFVRPVRVARQ